jgi:hypothetical protein
VVTSTGSTLAFTSSAAPIVRFRLFPQAAAPPSFSAALTRSSHGCKRRTGSWPSSDSKELTATFLLQTSPLANEGGMLPSPVSSLHISGIGNTLSAETPPFFEQATTPTPFPRFSREKRRCGERTAHGAERCWEAAESSALLREKRESLVGGCGGGVLKKVRLPRSWRGRFPPWCGSF